MLHAVIMAGGVGTRLWPLSREAAPKQLHAFGMDASLLQQAADRLRPLVPAERTWVVTGRRYLPAVADQLPDLPAATLLGEPTGRNTAPALGWAAEVLHRSDPDAVMVVLTADHVIRPKEVLQDAVRRAVEVLDREPWALVTFGIRPTRPHTGYGYLALGDKLAGAGPAAFQLEEFKEKPDLPTATRYVAGGRHLWNSGMFCWRAETYRKRLAEYEPGLAAGLRQAASRHAGDPAFDRDYAELKSISVDFAVMEPAGRAGLVRCVALDLEWHDLGGYEALRAVLPASADGNTVGAGVETVALDARGNIVLGRPGRTVALVGVSDLVVVETGDVTLVVPRSQAERVKDVVAELRRRGATGLL